MHRLEGIERAYPWGSRTAIPQLKGDQAPAPHPIAELWFGAHPASPSTVDGEPLSELIAQQPSAWLGERIADRYQNRLPYLVKILAADEPLSLQAHPSKQQAEDGWERENALGIPVGGAQRNYKDDNHKPEVLVALSEFEAMAGFRPLAQTIQLLRQLNCAAMERYLHMIDDGQALAEKEEENRLRALFTTWITIPTAARAELIQNLIGAIDALDETQVEPWIAHTVHNVRAINERYPNDIGVLGALLLNHVRLEPGEAIYLRAGSLHAYLHGVGVEVMANSDNVLRGGLTTKHVDVPELVKVLGFAPLVDPFVTTQSTTRAGTTITRYPVPIEDFTLSCAHIDAANPPLDLELNGPTILVATAGELTVTDAAGEQLTLRPTEAVWVDERDRAVSVATSESAHLFWAFA
ncbi:mannose-6-phosphate isomerase, class I [Corynebacterium sp. TAE3-ERU30]|uniref:mannose-6-phosphate isomerase, class I n=1 Tax=Corynebacterium sp. TAE3-ERU30 TaxID=2849496 RepID=UPI001C47BA41|nr:mannose-6-phosphate isomerase, class I [Corynebacterium sp. TAE3-ERU30]MBV7282769.1 mannose-6-phosphate isomerase, class I [Corynebacterium sp. TAE3-ERU30]